MYSIEQIRLIVDEYEKFKYSARVGEERDAWLDFEAAARKLEPKYLNLLNLYLQGYTTQEISHLQTKSYKTIHRKRKELMEHLFYFINGAGAENKSE